MINLYCIEVEWCSDNLVLKVIEAEEKPKTYAVKHQTWTERIPKAHIGKTHFLSPEAAWKNFADSQWEAAGRFGQMQENCIHRAATAAAKLLKLKEKIDD